MTGAPTPPGTRAGNGYGRCALAAATWAVLNIVLLVLLSGAPESAEAAGRVVGSLLVVVLLAALATWLIVRRRAPWAFWKLALLALPFVLLLRVLTAAAG